MTTSSIAALIAALAFVVLVVYLCQTIKKANTVLDEAQKTVEQVNEVLPELSKKADNVVGEVDELLKQVNTLAEDISQKIEKTDPLFKALGELGITISDLNESATDLVGKAFGINRDKSSKKPNIRKREKKNVKQTTESKIPEASRTAGKITINLDK